MLGNVWEWCQDLYGDYPEDTAVDPKGPAQGTLRVIHPKGVSPKGVRHQLII